MASNMSSMLLNLSGATGIGKRNLMRFVTGIKYTASVAKMLNNITFLYDPNWSYASFEEATLPLCFFFVTKWQEIGEGEISSKPMMFYNAQKTKNTQSVNGSVMNVVADNSIIQPKTYRAEVLIPFQPDAYFDQYQFDPDTLTGALAFATDNLGGNASASSVAVFGRTVSVALGVLRAIFTALSVDISFASLTNLILSQNDLNKVSLDAMRQNRGILKMKLWNGWKFKYVMLKTVEISKSGEMDGFYEGSLVLQEVPILNVGLTKKDVSVAEGRSIINAIMATKAKIQAEALNNAGGTR